MTLLPQPFVELIYNGVPVSSEFANYLLDFTWTDHLHGKADEIKAVLRDDQGLWRGVWAITKGDKIAASLGYRGGIVIPCGLFTVDKANSAFERGKSKVDFTAISAGYDKALRTQNNRSFEEKSLREVIEKIAGEHGFRVSGEIREVSIKITRQRRERDLEFIKRLAEDYGHYVSQKDEQLVFYPREQLASKIPVRTYDLAAPVIQARAEFTSDKTYGTAEVSYFDQDRKEVIKAEVKDESIISGDVLRIDEQVGDEAQAKALADGRLARANEEAGTANLTVVGDPLLLAGQTVALGLDYGVYAGNYLVDKAVHMLARANYTTLATITSIKVSSLVQAIPARQSRIFLIVSL